MNGSENEYFSDEFHFQHLKGYSYSHCSEYSPVLFNMPFFHDGVEDAFQEAVSISKYGFFCTKSVYEYVSVKIKIPLTHETRNINVENVNMRLL